jgi:hypothetical protein
VVGDGGEEGSKLPLLTLHNGPGACHDYLKPFEAMVATGRRVVFRDPTDAVGARIVRNDGFLRVAGGAAIANAIGDDTGARMTEMPVTSDRLFHALASSSAH